MPSLTSLTKEQNTRVKRPPRTMALLIGLVGLLAFLAFVPALANDFAFDDTLARSTTNDGHPDLVIGEAHAPWYYFGRQYWEGEGRESRLYRPITILSYALTYQLVAKPLLPAEWEAFPHHLINLLLNAWAAYLVFWLMRDLRVEAVAALLTAALFAVHALHSEVVAGIVGRAELFSFCFGVAGIQAFRRADSVHLGLWLSCSGLLFFLAMCAKENAVAWLPFLPCHVAARAWRSRIPAGPALRACAGRILAVCGPGLLLFLVLRGIAIHGWREDVFYTANPLYHQAAAVRWLSAIKIWGYAVYKCVAPFSLACLYGPPAIGLVQSPSDPGFLAAAAILLVWLVSGLRRPAQRPLLFLSVAVFFGFSFITSNLPLAIGTIFAERLYFIPSLGVCMLPALLALRLQTKARLVILLAALAWMAANVVVDFHRSQIWKDNQALMLNDARSQPDCASLQVKAATMHRWLQQEDPQREDLHQKEAWRLLRRAQALDPDYVNAIATEATFLSQDEEYDEALLLLRRALQAKRLQISGLEAGIRGDLGMLLIEKKKQKEEGLKQLAEAVRLRGRNLVLRIALLDHGIGSLPPDEVKQILIEGIDLYPHNVMMQVMQAAFIYEYGEINQANAQSIVEILEAVFRSVTRDHDRKKYYIRARLQLGRCLAALGRKAKARRCFEIVLSLDEARAEQKQEAKQGIADLSK